MMGNPWRSHDWPIYVVCALPPLGAVLLLAAELATRLSAGAWLPVTGANWLSLAAGPLRHPLSPGDGFPGAARVAAPGPALYWTTLLLLILAIGVPAVLLLRRRGSAPERATRRRHRLGFARTGEVRDALDGRSAGRVASIPGSRVNAKDWLLPRASSMPDEVGVPLGRDAATSRELWGTWEDSYGILGAPRQGKGLGFLVKLLATWPGPMVTTSTKPDNLTLTGLAVRDRPLWVFDPTGLSGWPDSVRWSPVAGCEDPAVASLRAEALVFASPEDPSVRGGRFWKDSAVTVLRCYLHAAALAGGDMRTVQRWARRHELDEPAAVLRGPDAAPGWVDDLDGLRRLAAETRGSVFGQLTVSLGFLATPEVLEACCPDPAHPSLDSEILLGQRGRLYLVGTAAGQRSMAPLVAALVETIADTARRTAARAPGGRLTPPLGLLIDEAAQIAPLPSLPSLLADGGGQGIVTVVVLQSLGQARERWGEHGATALWDACTAKLVFGGLSSARDLEAISKLCPDVDEPTASHTRGRDGHWSESVSQRRLPAMTPAQLRELERWHALLLYPGLRPVLTEQRPWWREPRYEQLIGAARERTPV